LESRSAGARKAADAERQVCVTVGVGVRS
jgi:hypothetical protein